MLRVKELIKEKGLTMADVASKMEMSGPGLSMALSRNMTLEVINRIAEAIGVEPWELFTKSTDKGNIAGYIEIDGVIHKISSKEDIKKIAEQLNIER